MIDLESVPVIDVTATDMLVDLDDELGSRGIALVLAREVGQARDMLRQAGADRLIERFHPTVDQAVDAARAGQPDPPPSEPDRDVG